MVKLATDIMTSYLTGRPSPVPALKEKKIPHYGVKMPVFPFKMFPEVDPVPYTNWQWNLVKTKDKKNWEIISWGY